MSGTGPGATAQLVQRVAQLGPVVQLGFVPEDVTAAAQFWTQTVGAGPFFVLENLVFPKVSYRGRAPTQLTITAMLAYWGELQIELIRQESAEVSLYSEWRDAGRHGVHHVALDAGDPQKSRATIAANGLTVVTDMQVASGAQVIYCEGAAKDAPFIEFLHPPARQRELFETLKAAHRSWDGTDPVRVLSLKK